MTGGCERVYLCGGGGSVRQVSRGSQRRSVAVKSACRKEIVGRRIRNNVWICWYSLYGSGTLALRKEDYMRRHGATDDWITNEEVFVGKQKKETV